MKKKNTFIVVALLLAVVVLGVGYAAATGPWVINGTATASANTDFDVDFTGTPTVTDGVTANITQDDELKTAEMTVTLTTMDDEESATFTLTNNSPEGIKAVIDENSISVTYEGEDGEVTATASEYFDVAYELADTEIPSGESTTLTVTVKLKKVALTEITEKFKVSIGTITADQE